MGKNILWVVALGVAAGIALPLVVLHSDDIEAVFQKPKPPAPPDVVVKSWVVRDQKMVAERVSHPAELADAEPAPVVHSRQYWNGPSYRPRLRARRAHVVRRRLDPAVRHTIESQDIAAWKEADQMLRIERAGGE